MKLSNQKIAQAATTFLERKSYEIRETDIDREYPLIVAADEFGLAFISCAAEVGAWPERTFTREEFEAAGSSGTTWTCRASPGLTSLRSHSLGRGGEAEPRKGLFLC